MEWRLIIELLDPKLMIVLAVCWIWGYILKRTPRVPNWSIIFIVMAIAVLFAVWMLGWGPLALLQGVLCGAVAVYGYEAYKAAREGAVGK